MKVAQLEGFSADTVVEGDQRLCSARASSCRACPWTTLMC